MECEHGSRRSVGTVKIIHSMNWDRTASQGVRNVTWVNALASFDRHKHSVLSSETFRCLESGTFHHSRDFWFQIQRSANEVYNQAWLSESLDFGKTGSVLPKFCIYTSWNPLRNFLCLCVTYEPRVARLETRTKRSSPVKKRETKGRRSVTDSG